MLSEQFSSGYVCSPNAVWAAEAMERKGGSGCSKVTMPIQRVSSDISLPPELLRD